VTRIVAVVAFLTAITGAIVLAAERTGDGGRPLVDRFQVTSGSWQRASDGTGARTSSTTFRARSREGRLDAPRMTLDFRIDVFGDTGPEHDWDGVHVGLRYASPDDVYYVSLARRDGTVTIKRKAGGTYETLASAEHDVDLGRWHEAEVWVREDDEGVRVQLRLDGDVLLEAIDHEPLPAGGRVSLRTDNASVTFADVQVRDTA
jgi:hypothetical protein